MKTNRPEPLAVPCALAIAVLALAGPLAGPLAAADWPMWRHDAGRSAATTEQLAGSLSLQWSRQLPPLEATWPDQPKLTIDRTYQPVAAAGLLFVGSSHDDSLCAYDLLTGKLRWRYIADGPIRYAPVASTDRVWFAADDGWLRCLDAKTGKLRWRFRGGPGDRRVLGNGRLISMWPARGAPVLLDDTIYFAAGIWPFMGIFVHAVDAETGKPRWVNDTTGSIYIQQPHNSPAFAGLAPQGYLAAVGAALVVPNGRAVPARLDRATGQLEYFHLAKHRRSGGDQVAACPTLFFSGSAAFDLPTGVDTVSLGGTRSPILDKDTAYAGGGTLRAINIAKPVITETKDKKDRVQTKLTLEERWKAKLSAELFLKAGSRLYGTAGDDVVAIELPADDGKPAVSWRTRIKGTVSGMIAADGRLVVVTRDRIDCFGPEPVANPPQHSPAPVVSLAKNDPAREVTARWLEASGVTGGVVVVLGLDDGRMVEALALEPGFKIIGVDSNSRRVAGVRRRLATAGIPSARAAVFVADPLTIGFPRYLASLVVTEKLSNSGFAAGRAFVEQVYHVLRPYGGTAVLPVPDNRLESWRKTIASAGLSSARLSRSGDWSLLARSGSLPGSAPWTHQYADPSNTSVSRDKLVKAPLGLLWFGGSSNTAILPRHGHGPSEQVAGGRLFIEGPDLLRAVDVYTGRVLWEKSLPGLGKPYNITGHQPGANAIGSNYASTADAVYVAYEAKALRLDAATGETVAEFTLPPASGGKPPRWGYISVWGDLLVAGAQPLAFEEKRVGDYTQDGTTSKRLIVLDRHTGKVLWQQEARYGFRHNAIAIGNGRLFAIDRLSDSVLKILARRGVKTTGQPRLTAWDARTGKELWNTEQDVFGTWLGFSAGHDRLLQCGRPARDMLRDEPANRMIVYHGRSGKVAWDKPIRYGGPCLLHRRSIITQESAVDLLTGEPVERTNPLTGRREPWQFSRNYGCNSAVASECLLTFRSAAAGYYDLSGDSGTGNLGGFRSSCTSNLIVADGVLNAPDYTRTCSCSYQNQASLALVHMPEADMWTFNKLPLGDQPIRRLGINLGAPGDRKSDAGTLWLEYPIVGGPSPKLGLAVSPEQPSWFRRHPSAVAGSESVPAWIAASGASGLDSLSLKLPGKGRYTVRLVFAELEDRTAGQRRFSVSLGDRRVLENFDIVKAAGGPRHAVIRSFSGIQVDGSLSITLTAAEGSAPPVLCGIEVIAE